MRSAVLAALGRVPAFTEARHGRVIRGGSWFIRQGVPREACPAERALARQGFRVAAWP